MAWGEQQTRFADALLDPARGVPEFVAKTAGKPSGKRFNVYRNNVMVGLTEAILDSYPVTGAMVGEEFATAMARVYVGQHLPQSPVLLEYGADYATFIEGFEPAQSLPYLADMARLEWGWLQAYHSADHAPLAIEALSRIEEEQLIHTGFVFCPSVFLLRSSYPVVSLWSAHQCSETGPEPARIEPGAECVLINRPLWEVNVRTLEPSTFAFFQSLYRGRSLGQAIDKGNCWANFDPAGSISALFETGCIAELKRT